jgi:hypothetical protein
MSSKGDMNRKEFLTLTFTLIGATAVGAAACDDNNNNAVDASGNAGTSGTGRGGSGGTGTAGTTGTGGAGGNTAANCTDPLPEMQIADSTMHTHTLTIAATALSSTSAMTFDTGVTDAHMHMVTLQPADLSTIKGGGMVTVTTGSAGTPAHTHMFRVSCH